MKLWQKNTTVSGAVETFTVGKDREMDLLLAPFDVLGSIAHVTMLAEVGLLTKEEAVIVNKELRNIYHNIHLAKESHGHSSHKGVPGTFTIHEGIEDIHSQIEFMLTEKIGEAGKKIHSARSRNDQVLVDIKLFLRHEIRLLAEETESLFHLLQQQSEQYKDHLLPGYTHLQLAMPSSFGLWFGAYAESLADDMISLQAAYKVVNKNPLGSAAGYGSSFPINRTLTTQLLGFDDLNYNVVYAQMGRGKAERITAMAMANIADTLSRMSMDMCLYLNQNFDFVSFPPELTTGSSIMPHKKNPDVFELIRSHSNRIKALPNEIMLMATNLPSGYHRDLQLLKEHLFPAFTTIRQCLQMAQLMLSAIEIKTGIMQDARYLYAFSVEEVNKLVLQGVPFRDAYKQVGMQIEEGKFKAATGQVQHTHEGSIGNLCNEQINAMMQRIIAGFQFEKAGKAIQMLLEE